MFKNMKVATSMILVLLVFALLQIVSNMTAFSFIKSAKDNINFLSVTSDEQAALTANRILTLRAQSQIDNIMLEVENNPAFNPRGALAEVRDSLKDADKQYNLFVQIPGISTQKPEIGDAMQKVYDARKKTLLDQVDVIENSPNAPVLIQNFNKLKDVKIQSMVAYATQVDSYTKATRAILLQNAQDSVNAYNTFVGLLIGALIFIVAISIFVHMWLRRILVAPLEQIVEHFSFMSRGDLSRSIDATSSNEVGQLFNGLKEMQAGLVETVSSVRNGVDSISVGTREIAAGNQDLSSRTEQQAAALAETAAAMEQLTSTVKHNADNAQEASKMILSTTTVARNGGEIMSTVVTKMHTINSSAHKVTDIISVIDSIAFQTNILALNAAVEAARAGEQGRGFAVVAGEVRSLAQRCAQAAKEINGLIKESTNGIREGVTLVENAGQTMAEIVKSVEHVTQLMESISYASDEQSQGIEQVRIAINEMDKVTQQNAALVEEVAVTASGVESQSDALAQSVATFQL